MSADAILTTAAQVIPVFLLALVLESRTVTDRLDHLQHLRSRELDAMSEVADGLMAATDAAVAAVVADREQLGEEIRSRYASDYFLNAQWFMAGEFVMARLNTERELRPIRVAMIAAAIGEIVALGGLLTPREPIAAPASWVALAATLVTGGVLWLLLWRRMKGHGLKPAWEPAKGFNDSEARLAVAEGLRTKINDAFQAGVSRDEVAEQFAAHFAARRKADPNRQA